MLEWPRGRSSKFYRDTIYQAEDNEIMTTNYDKS